MQMMEQAAQFSQVQARVAGEVGRAANTCFGAMFDASMAFAKSNAESQRAFATAILSAKSPASAADLHLTWVRDTFQSAGELATKMAEAFAVAAKTCEAEAAKTLAAAPEKGA